MPRMGITAYDLLISCPGDVNKFIHVIRECVESFNKTFGVINNCEIVTKHWSTDSYPQSGDKAQELLNKQFVRDCDVAVAIFWTKFGTPTDKYGSGTEEEIEEMLSSGKQVFMYFLDAPINPSSVNMEQYKKVVEFKEKYKDRGIYVTVKDGNELRKQFTNHLAMHFLPLMSGEKIIDFKKAMPLLKIRDAEATDGIKAIVRKSNLSKCKLIKEKAIAISEQIALLNKDFLPQREEPKVDEQKSNITFTKDIDFQKLLGKPNLMPETISDAHVPEQWRSTILEFINRNAINIEPQFWNVGNLKKKVKLLVPIYGGNGTSFDGKEDEKKRYEAIQNLYWNIEEYNEYETFFAAIDKQKTINLVLTNIGDTFDEDIDVKLIIKNGCINDIKYFPIPGINIIDDILKMKLSEYLYKIKDNDTVDAYSGYSLLIPNLNYNIPNFLGGPSAQEEYERHKQKYENELERIFCYTHYNRGGYDILTFHIDYLKHNTAMAFPSALVFDNIPETIEYEITSKYVAEIIKGKIELVE